MEIRGRIARKTFSLTFPDDNRTPEHWKNFFGAHLREATNEEPDARVTLTPREAADVPLERQGVFRDTEGPDIRYRVVRHDMSGELIERGGRFEGTFFGSVEGYTPISMALKVVLALLCEAGGELLVHASAVRRNGLVWVFSGPSGSGKSTIAEQLVGGGEVIALDNAVLSIGEDGVPVVDSTPFSDLKSIGIWAESEPAGGIAFIEQASRAAISHLSVHEALLALLSESLVFSGDDNRYDRIMGVAGAIAESGVCRRLEFAKDETFWKCLEGISPAERRLSNDEE